MRSDVAARLREFMGTFPIVDTHEHLAAERVRIGQRVDFSTLLSHYCMYDLVAAGMPKPEFDAFYSPDTAVAEKWRVFEPWYDEIRTGSYGRAAHLAMERFYGCERITSVNDAEAVTERIRATNVPGLYRRVLKEACGLKTSIVCGPTESDPEFFHCVASMGGFVNVRSVAELERLCALMGAPASTTLSRYVDAIGQYVRRIAAKGVRGLKLALAYERDLDFQGTTTADAERVFDRIHEESQGWRGVVLGYDETRSLQDYLVHRLAEMAAEAGIALVFHTGIQTGNNNRPDNCRPERLWSLVHRHPATTFVLLHAGLPWTDEAGMLAKYFANVHLDMAWMHIISPEIARRALRTWVDMVPRNKVFGFGGDYCVVEKVYGHLVMAKENMSATLAAKVDEGAISGEDAYGWAKALLHDNPTRVYRLDE